MDGSSEKWQVSSLASSTKGYLMIMGAGVCWATTGLFGTVLFRHAVDPLLVASGRLSLGALLFILLLLLSNRDKFKLKRTELPLLLLAGFVGVAIFNYCYLQAIHLLGVSVSVVLLYTAPAFVIIISRMVLKELITPVKVGALLLTITGVVLVTGVYDRGDWSLNLWGLALGLGAGFTFGLMNIFSKLAVRNNSSYTITFYVMSIGAFILALLRPPWLLWHAGLTPPAMLALLGLGVISTFLAYLLFIGGMKYLEAGRASITAAVEPVAAFGLAALFLGERLVTLQFVGFFFVITAVLLLVVRR